MPAPKAAGSVAGLYLGFGVVSLVLVLFWVFALLVA